MFDDNVLFFAYKLNHFSSVVLGNIVVELAGIQQGMSLARDLKGMK